MIDINSKSTKCTYKLQIHASREEKMKKQYNIISKPKEILELEKVYSITLTPTIENEFVGFNCYQINSEYEIVGLSIFYNQIREIKGLEKLTKLKILDLSSNQISEIEGLEKLTKLQCLILSDNQIKEIKGLEQLTQLQKLDLSSNQISEIEGLEQLTQLQNLNLYDNQIREIKGLEKLTQLQNLSLLVNQISEIKGLEKLIQLKILNLSDNQISKIKGLEKLAQLKTLKLYRNHIISIESLVDIIISLKELEIYDNHFSNPHIESKGNNLDVVQKYFSDKNLKQKEFKLPVKVMLLGNHAAGKSTFFHYFKNNELPQEGAVGSTHILKIEPYYLTFKHNLQEEIIKLPDAMIYDFGGHDYYHGIYRAFFSQKSITLLVWCKKSDKNDIRQTENNLGHTRDFTRNYWLHQLKFFNEQVHESIEKKQEIILMVQTHLDEDEKDEYKGSNCDFDISSYYVSLNTDFVANNEKFERYLNRLKEDLFHEISTKRTETIKKRPEYYETFLNFVINYQDWQCIEVEEIFKYKYKRDKNEGETDDHLRKFLKMDLQDLNDTGLIIYYESDEYLNNVVWLNPQKTIKYIHDNILSIDSISKKKGKVPEASFKEIFKDKEEIKRLLLNQKVIFHDKFNEQYIIPGYLSLVVDENGKVDHEYRKCLTYTGINDEKPDYTLRFKNFLPFGLINQLICFYGGKPDFKDFWRDRLIFTFDKTYKVLIILDFSNLEINVYIKVDDEKSLVSLNDFKKHIFFNIIDLYYDDKERKHKYRTPEDLYISVNGDNYFVHHWNIEEQVEKNLNTITVFPISEETKEIDMEKTTTRDISDYVIFTYNKNIKMTKKKIFISYSKEDKETYMHKFLKAIKSLCDEGLIEPWMDEWIEIGKEWDAEIQRNIEECDIMVCLVSDDFLNTHYIRKKEVAKAMEEEKKLYPIIIRPCDWEKCDFAKYQVALKGECIAYNNKEKRERTDVEKDAMWKEVINEIRAKIFSYAN